MPASFNMLATSDSNWIFRIFASGHQASKLCDRHKRPSEDLYAGLSSSDPNYCLQVGFRHV